MNQPMPTSTAIERALAWLADVQEGDGDIPVFACRRRDLSGHRHLDSSPFNVVHILEGVRACSGPAAASIAAGLEGYLWRAASERATWSYFAPKTGRQIDDDLDDTCCCAALLRDGAPDAAARLAANLELVLGNRDSEGRFMTWLRATAAPNDIDAVVNANVLWYLGDHPEASRAAAWLCELVLAGRERSAVLYYESELTLYFALARALNAGALALEPIRAPILARLEVLAFASLDVVELSFACAAIQRLRGPERLAGQLLEALLARQCDDGSFPAAPVWNGPEHPAPRAVWWGGEPLSTGLALNCLAWGAQPA